MIFQLIRSYHRLLDLKDGKHLDLEVLKILVEAVTKNILDNSGVGAGRYFLNNGMKGNTVVSEYWTSPVFEWLKPVLLLNGSDSEW